MKKLLFSVLVLVLIGCKCGCSDPPTNPKGNSDYLKIVGRVAVHEFEYESHKYLVGHALASNEGGVVITHSESCPCKASK